MIVDNRNAGPPRGCPLPPRRVRAAGGPRGLGPLAIGLALALSAGLAARPLPVRAIQETGAAGLDTSDLVTTRHRISIEGREIAYAVRAGRLPIRHNETGEIRGHVFFTHYAVERSAGEPPRPLTFLWNGGPGANSVLVHLLGFGPMRIRTPDAATDPPGCDCALEPNGGTWLGSTDLVFVDPVGTGFSRPKRAEYGSDFYGVREDAASIAEFIRLFLTRFDAWDSPLFVGGESYGTWRAAGVARALEEAAIPVAGVLLISGGVPVGPVETEEMRVALLITARTAAAFHHGRLPDDLQRRGLAAALHDAGVWARDAYAPALARRDALTSEERARIVDGLARFTGLPADRIDADALVVQRADFAELLLADRGQRLDRFDTRLTADRPEPPAGARATLVGRYLRDTLGYRTGAAYQGLESGYRPVDDTLPAGPGARWRWNHASPDEAPPARLTSGDGPPGARPAWLRDAMTSNPRLRVYVATGLFDSLNSCDLNAHLVDRLEPGLAERFTLGCYPGGHMMYEDRDTRLRMRDDVARFIDAAVEARTQVREARGTGVRAAGPVPDPAGRAGDVVATRHSISLDGGTLDYLARAGRLPILDDETGVARAHVFFVSYAVEPAPGATRPLVFAWNGGPGSNAGLLHMTAMGPRRLRMDDVYAAADPDAMRGLVDNEATWLAAADLVFVDPVGTGYSRPARAEYGPEFYDTVGDVLSLAEFIRAYRARYAAWDAPIVLVGESYGSLRAAAVARELEAGGIPVAGLVFISGSPGLAPIPDLVAAPLLLPALAATAAYHGASRSGTPDSLAARARDWARDTYAPALARLESLSASERAAIVDSLERFTGIPASRIDGADLVVDMPAFTETLLQGQVLGRYDARMSRPRMGDESLFDPRADASLAPLENRISGNAPTMLRYLRRELGYENDLFYIGPFGGAWPPPDRFRGDWMSVRWNRSEGPAAPLVDVLAAEPELSVLHASGRYDLVTPAGPPAWQIARLEPAFRDRFAVRVYEGGHSFYLDRASRLAFTRDATRLLRDLSEGR